MCKVSRAFEIAKFSLPGAGWQLYTAPARNGLQLERGARTGILSDVRRW